MQERNRERNEKGNEELLAKINTLCNMRNAKEEAKKKSNAQEDKKNRLQRQIVWRRHRMKRCMNQGVLMIIHLKFRQFSPLGRIIRSLCMKSSDLAMLKLLGSLSKTFLGASHEWCGCCLSVLHFFNA